MEALIPFINFNILKKQIQVESFLNNIKTELEHRKTYRFSNVHVHDMCSKMDPQRRLCGTLLRNNNQQIKLNARSRPKDTQGSQD